MSAPDAEALQGEIAVLRHALLDALAVFEIGQGSLFRRYYAEVIARAEAAAPVTPPDPAEVRAILAHCLLMGRGIYGNPEEWADAILRRLAHESLQVSRKGR